eukprot:6651711-Pyramimonas_sp.AAC.1
MVAVGLLAARAAANWPAPVAQTIAVRGPKPQDARRIVHSLDESPDGAGGPTWLCEGPTQRL